jgi:methylenetetrahydrofolate--tRNA-(uracil-5-)-methyltransferase
MELRSRPELFFAGQLTGVEGYVGNIATGLVAGINMARKLSGRSEWIVPNSTMLGALCHYVTHSAPEYFQPMKANFGIMPELPQHVKNKRDRAAQYASRALKEIQISIESLSDDTISVAQVAL